VTGESSLTKNESGNHASGRFRSSVVAAWHHAVRTPLHGVIAATGYFDEKDPIAPDVLRALQASGRHVESTVNALLELLDAMIGPPLDEGLTTAADLLSDVAATVGPLADTRSVKLTVDQHDAGLIPARDSRRWHYLLVRTLERVMNHVPPGGEVTVRLSGGAGSREHRWLQARLSVVGANGRVAERWTHALDEGVLWTDPQFGWLLAETALRIMDGRWSWGATSEGTTLHLVAPIQR
jgi:signal transduction histidine kinase